jgi:hypothetical protein
MSFYSNLCDVKNAGWVGVEWIHFARERENDWLLGTSLTCVECVILAGDILLLPINSIY